MRVGPVPPARMTFTLTCQVLLAGGTGPTAEEPDHQFKQNRQAIIRDSYDPITARFAVCRSASSVASTTSIGTPFVHSRLEKRTRGQTPGQRGNSLIPASQPQANHRCPSLDCGVRVAGSLHVWHHNSERAFSIVDLVE